MNAIKKIFKLIRLGVFCKWFTNVNNIPAGFRILMFENYSWRDFIGSSFVWDRTGEGRSFWQNISEK